MKKSEFKNMDLTPLDNYLLEGINASVMLDLRRSKDNDSYPVKIRVTHLRRQVYYPCMDLTAQEYSDLHKAVRSPYLQKTKKLVTACFKHITDTIEDIVTNGSFTLESLNQRLKKGTADSVLNAFDNRIAELEKKGKIGTAVWYSCAKKSIDSYAQKDIKFADVTVSWLENYEAQQRKEGKEYTTISMYLRALRAIINEGLKGGIISQAQYPFLIKNNKKYKIPVGTGRKIALNAAQLMDVFNYPLSPENEKWRDLWVFSFYANGMNINDLLRLKYSNISGNYIEWLRKKTESTDQDKSKIRAVITEEMRQIIDKYGNPEHKPSNYIFPYLTAGLSPLAERMIIQNVTHTINKKMKKIGRALGYGDITTYWARHTFASISRTGNVSLFGISKSLGHKNLSTTQVYLDSLSDDELIKNAAVLPRRK